MTTTKIFKIEDPLKEYEKIKTAADVIINGGLVAFPTETVYGLGANALDSKAAKKIYQAKGRPSDNPLIVHLSDISKVNEYVYIEGKYDMQFMDKFWPGPLTLVMRKKSKIPDTVTAGLKTVAIRIPSHPVARLLIKEAKVPIAAPSANISGRPSTTESEHVIDDLNGKVDVIICGGSSVYGLESTVLDITSKPPVILRPGFITKDDLMPFNPDVKQENLKNGNKPKSPGMKYRHYAPKAKLNLIRGKDVDIVNFINESYEKQINEKACVLTTDEYKHSYKGKTVYSLGKLKSPSQIAANLFKILRQIDKTDINTIYAAYLEGEGLFFSIMNRLKKAAGDTIIDLRK